MAWDSIWEEIFKTRAWGRYPPEELIRFVAKHYYDAADRATVRFLEVGCGAGANVWFLAREGFSATGLDRSPTAIARARELLERDALTADFVCADAMDVASLFPPGCFDVIIDVACLQCNRLGDVRRFANEAMQVLKPNGRMFSMTLARGSLGEGLGEELEPGTFRSVAEGPVKGTGLNHFFSLEELECVYSNYRNVSIEYSIRSLGNRSSEHRCWVIEAECPHE
jgi:SAM-dependent methyltransferase